MHPQDGHELAEHSEPAQPQQRLEPHVAGPVMVLGVPNMTLNVARGRGLIQTSRPGAG